MRSITFKLSDAEFGRLWAAVVAVPGRSMSVWIREKLLADLPVDVVAAPKKAETLWAAGKTKSSRGRAGKAVLRTARAVRRRGRGSKVAHRS